MSMTALVKAELSRLEVTRTSERKAEVAALLRCAGGAHLTGGRLVIEAELDSGAAARRLRHTLGEVYGYTSGVSVLNGGIGRREVRYLIRITRHGEGLARQTGLLDARGRLIRGLPPAIVSGSLGELAAAWRGAFLARGTLTPPGRAAALEIACPSPETAVALIGVARRLGVPVKARESRGTHHVIVRDTISDTHAIPRLLARMGAPDAVLAWTEQRMRREVRATANRVANFDAANASRAAQAAAAASSRVQRALQILDGDAPAHLLAAGHLRLEHRDASLTELGQRADPPLSKDAIAGHLRRLLTLADSVADTFGIPDTTSTPGL